jgi:hypothetical protein
MKRYLTIPLPSRITGAKECGCRAKVKAWTDGSSNGNGATVPGQTIISSTANRLSLSPLIVAHFLSVVREFVKRGLKKDYVHASATAHPA